MWKTFTPRKMGFAEGRLWTSHLHDAGYLLQV